MTLKIINGDMFTATLGTNCVIVHGVSSSGTFSGGVAPIVKKLYPMAELKYRQAYKRSGLKIGQVVLYTPELQRKDVSIANAVVYGNTRTLEYDTIIDVLQQVKALADGKPIHLRMIEGSNTDRKRLVAIYEAILHDVQATLWLGQDEEI